MTDDDRRRVAVVVVAYGSPGPLATALAGVEGHEVVIVDNSSDPATAALADRAGARYIDPGTNLGFAAGVNRALAVLPIPDVDVLLLNPDARVDAEAVSALGGTLRSDRALGAVAPVLRGADGTTEVGLWPWHTPGRAWTEALGLRRPRGGGFLSGAVLLLRGDALAEVGGFDERFFLYAEEEDWQRRALARGWNVRHCTDVAAVHERGGTQDELHRQQLRLHAAVERYVRKWFGAGGWLTYRAGTVVGQLGRAVMRRGWRRRSALEIASWYLRGPDRVARREGAVPPVSG